MCTSTNMARYKRHSRQARHFMEYKCIIRIIWVIRCSIETPVQIAICMVIIHMHTFSQLNCIKKHHWSKHRKKKSNSIEFHNYEDRKNPISVTPVILIFSLWGVKKFKTLFCINFFLPTLTLFSNIGTSSKRNIRNRIRISNKQRR